MNSGNHCAVVSCPAVNLLVMMVDRRPRKVEMEDRTSRRMAFLEVAILEAAILMGG